MGRVHSTQIPIAIDWAAFKQHILVAGATGSGKSNTVANLIKAAQSHGACVIIYDQKPDYQHIDRANDERHLFEAWSKMTAISASALKNVVKYCLWQGAEEQGKQEIPIAVRAREVDLDMLVSALFYQSDEGNQRDTFQTLLRHHIADRKEWTLDQFVQWLSGARQRSQGRAQTGSELEQLYERQGWGRPNDANIDAILRKIASRKPKWIDSLKELHGSSPPTGIWGKQGSPPSVLTGYFTPLKNLDAGKVMVIRTNATGREYGLFLSYLLNQVYDLRRSGAINFPVVNIVDEAQDIFQGGTAIRDTAAFTMNEIIRKGRSKDISFVIAVQSVSQTPDSVLTNLNSRIIHRQNSVEELRRAIPSATRELMANSLTFGPGEALVSIIGARSVVRAEMAPSPFELTKTSAIARKTLADQDEMLQQQPISDGESSENAPKKEKTEFVGEQFFRKG